MDRDLYVKLYQLREKLKNESAKEGRKRQICSDDSLEEIARLKPENKQEFLNINGLGQIFVDRYGDAFMAVLKSHYGENKTMDLMTDDVRKTLDNLENRLVNISRNNRLLYMGKLNNKFAYDLVDHEDIDLIDDLKELVVGKSKKIKICDISTKSIDIEKHKRKYEKLTALYREVNKDARESGGYDLYVGYPFVIGKTMGEDFSVHAPLALFPVEIIRDADSYFIKLDTDKDILYNTNLILMHNKFNNIHEDLPQNEIEDISENFVDDLISYFKASGIDIEKKEYYTDELENFKEYSVKNFPNYKNGEYYIENNMVLGKFSLYSSYLQKDFKKISESNEINELVNKLLVKSENIDIYADSESEEKDSVINEKEVFKEKNINYINDLNASQENAVLSIGKTNELVIQGPPGTGKSQTIVSLIADAVAKGQNVLMVSQKKAALDVIYSRLGNLSNQTILLHDVKDKNSFYKQVSNLMYTTTSQSFSNSEFDRTSNYIDSEVSKFQAISDILYNSEFIGEKAYKIYQENMHNYFKTNKMDTVPYYEIVNPKLYDITYTSLKDIKQKFTDLFIFENALKFDELNKKYPILKNLRDNLSNHEVIMLNQDFDNFVKEQKDFLSRNFIVKFFKSFKRKKLLKELIKKYFNNNLSFKEIYQNPDVVMPAIGCYNDFLSLKPIYEILSDIEKIYIDSSNKMKALNVENHELNQRLFDFVVFNHIELFEARNRLPFAYTKNFDNIYKTINNTMEEKKAVTKQKIKYLLSTAYRTSIGSSKRFGDIKRIVDGKRKWSISKFIDRFRFELFRGVKVWLMTPEVVSEILPLENDLFDLLVFDEASQIYIERGIPAISRAKKVVISGDHKQLRPSSLGVGRIGGSEEEQEEVDEDNAALEEESLLDLARFKYPEVVLNFHYRSKYEELIAFSNYAFYKGRLNVSPNIENPQEPPIEVIKIDNGLWEGRTNINEAIKTIEVVKNFLKTRKNKETIGVITFNVNQRDLILDLLDEECKKDSEFSRIYNIELNRKDNGEDIGFFVKNIENIQGDERDCIIFSISYAKNNQGKVVRNFGWLNQLGGENRLNVAISRAKKKIYIVTSIEPEELVTDDLKNEGPKVFRKYLEYSKAISNKDNILAGQILRSLSKDQMQTVQEDEMVEKLEFEIYNELKTQGFNVERQVGIGGYKIDIAIKSSDNSKYVLGLELDGKIYTTVENTRERDIHKRKYLEARGWKIMRIWSHEWYKSKEKVIAEIKELF